ncbi:MAG: L-threonylcarbamoyladenylate synthase, partial [Candidatus Omnitrophica bacterium]|nr:L-threonylcarbamoyladenylate synthase [Candidatus Omnitrophota bacterium]
MPETKIITLNPLDIDLEPLKQAGEILRRGGLVIIPTDTVYGIAANSLNRKAMERLYQAKQRAHEKNCSLLIGSKEGVEDLAKDIPITAYKLIDKFWPGALTIILKSAKAGTIGLRMPDDEIALRIIELSGMPLVCPSANISGKPAPKDFSEAVAPFKGLVEMAIDAGVTLLGV